MCGTGRGINGDIFGHQTLYAYGEAPTTDALVRRWLSGMKTGIPKFATVFRDPVVRFVSGVHYCESKTRVPRRPPAVS